MPLNLLTPPIRRRELMTVMKSRALVHRKFEDRLSGDRSEGRSPASGAPGYAMASSETFKGRKVRPSGDHSSGAAEMATAEVTGASR